MYLPSETIPPNPYSPARTGLQRVSARLRFGLHGSRRLMGGLDTEKLEATKSLVNFEMIICGSLGFVRYLGLVGIIRIFGDIDWE